MKTKEGIPMPGAKRENQNEPNGGKEKKPLVLPKQDERANRKSGHEAHAMPAKAKGIKK